MKPAYDRVAAWLEEDGKNASADTAGRVGAAGRRRTTTTRRSSCRRRRTMTADEIHALGLSEVARLRAAMEAIKAQVGFKGTLNEFFAFMRTRSRSSTSPTPTRGAPRTSRSPRSISAT